MKNIGKLNKDDSKYLKTAARLLRQGNSMLLNISKKTDIDVVSAVTTQIHDEIEVALGKIDSIEDYIATGKYVQLSLDFLEDETEKTELQENTPEIP